MAGAGCEESGAGLSSRMAARAAGWRHRAYHTLFLCTWQLGEFPLLMIVTNLLFLEPGELRLLRPRQPRAHTCLEPGAAKGAAQGVTEGAAPPATEDTCEAGRAMVAVQPGRWPLTAAAVLLAVQLLLPLRPLLASGLDPLDAVSAALSASHTPAAAFAPPGAAPLAASSAGAHQVTHALQLALHGRDHTQLRQRDATLRAAGGEPAHDAHLQQAGARAPRQRQ